VAKKFVNPFRGEDKKTRDILVACVTIQTDTLYVIVNHWPSRRGGEAASNSLRVHTAAVVLHISDSIRQKDRNAKIIIIGDFNDEPANQSMQSLQKSGFINLSATLQSTCNCGTYKFKSQWDMFDQMLVSQALATGKGLSVVPGGLRIIQPDFMLKEDTRNGGMMPFRTYNGMHYQGGYSDHLPIVLDLSVN
jgi:predicted extracellular nuclease